MLPAGDDGAVGATSASPEAVNEASLTPPPQDEGKGEAVRAVSEEAPSALPHQRFSDDDDDGDDDDEASSVGDAVARVSQDAAPRRAPGGAPAATSMAESMRRRAAEARRRAAELATQLQQRAKAARETVAAAAADKAPKGYGRAPAAADRPRESTSSLDDVDLASPRRSEAEDFYADVDSDLEGEEAPPAAPFAAAAPAERAKSNRSETMQGYLSRMVASTRSSKDAPGGDAGLPAAAPAGGRPTSMGTSFKLGGDLKVAQAKTQQLLSHLASSSRQLSSKMHTRRPAGEDRLPADDLSADAAEGAAAEGAAAPPAPGEGGVDMDDVSLEADDGRPAAAPGATSSKPATAGAAQPAAAGPADGGPSLASRKAELAAAAAAAKAAASTTAAAAAKAAGAAAASTAKRLFDGVRHRATAPSAARHADDEPPPRDSECELDEVRLTEELLL
ncbi:hypothetical protein M885DRAFT_592590 [Pelagophyceae sp. CCMP2097]|nr:hypothetical protein M885DRAFT_592590 [Pelagophyceae sp. CCMP2097]